MKLPTARVISGVFGVIPKMVSEGGVRSSQSSEIDASAPESPSPLATNVVVVVVELGAGTPDTSFESF